MEAEKRRFEKHLMFFAPLGEHAKPGEAQPVQPPWMGDGVTPTRVAG